MKLQNQIVKIVEEGFTIAKGKLELYKTIHDKYVIKERFNLGPITDCKDYVIFHKIPDAIDYFLTHA